MNEQDEIKKTKYQNITLGVLIALLAISALGTLWVSSGQ